MLANYLHNIRDITPQDKEHTHRAALQYLLESLLKASIANGGGGVNQSSLKSLRIIHEPKNDKEGRGAPDFLVLNNGLSIGYIENKRVNANLDFIAGDSQIAKYLALSENILLTDYLRFCLVRPNASNEVQIIKEVRICELSQLKTILNNKSHIESKAKELLELFTLFFTHNPKPINTALEFANALSLRTRILKDELLDNSQNPKIQSLFHTFKETLYKELDFIDFVDSFAQTLTYSLFLARLNNTKNKEIDLFNAKKFIPKSFLLIKAMAGFLDNLEELENIKWLLEEILHIINHINIADLTEELNKIAQKDLLGDSLHKDPYLHFYETFLSSYDPKLRELRGVYYTPAPVVSFIIDAIDSLLKRDFSQKQGLTSAMSNENITLLDFATGTGTFLLESFRKALQDMPKNSPKYNPKALIQRFYGFEFLIAPYTIAHLKISQCFKEEFKTPLSEEESLNITLTNTLYFEIEKKAQERENNLFAGMVELAQEFQKAQKIKENEILIITGNPPYSGASSNKGLYEDEVRITYGLEPSLAKLTEREIQCLKEYFVAKATMPPKDKDSYKTWYEKNKTKFSTFKAILERHKLQNEKNPKWLLDDYVKFIRFAESKIESQDSGIFAFISNNSFLDNPTFRGMRYHLMQTFDKLYVLDLHGSTRKKELTPDGGKDENVFDIMQGVSINIFVKSRDCHCEDSLFHHSERSEESKRESKEPHCKIYHYDLYGKRKGKYAFLHENTLDTIAWQILNPKPPFFLFIPQNENLRKEYDKGISVKDMFRISGVGICSKRDHIVFHNSKESLKKLLQDFITKPKEELYRIYNIGEDSRDWKLDTAIEAVKENKDNLEDFIMKCHYRPFDYRYTYYINKSRAFMAYPVYDIFEHFLQASQNKALLVSRQASAIGEKDFDATFVSDEMVDINFYRRGGEQVMPLYLNNTESTKKNLEKCELGRLEEVEDIFKGQERIENFTPEFRAFVDSKYTWDHKDYKANPELFKSSLREGKATEAIQNLDCHGDKSLRNDHIADGYTLTPEAILGYIYAVLFHKDYREKYIDFLKIDFPKIPFVESKEKFIALSKLGLELMSAFNARQSREQKQMRMGRNIALNIARQSKLAGSWQYAIVTDTIVDLCLMGGGNTGAGQIFPLYLYNTERARKILCKI